MISETLWLKTDNQDWKFYIKTLDEKFNKSFSLSEVIEIEKNFVIKTFKKSRICKQYVRMYINI
ncbi:hypothetical protein SIXOD_v1c28700 (plasmid) [Spiroplasma ixodetis Y32]|nr:hypothetical protein SIXOD_v1c28700 [Spiroplasma ixodetis Y32]